MCSTRMRRTRTRTCRRGHSTMRKVARTPLALCTSSLCPASQTRVPRSRPPHNQRKDSNSIRIININKNRSRSNSISKRLWHQPHPSRVRTQPRRQEESTRGDTPSAKARCQIRTGPPTPPAQRSAMRRGPRARGPEVPVWVLVRLGRRRWQDSLPRCMWASRALARESECVSFFLFFFIMETDVKRACVLM